ncbi:MAG: hypothetical protein FWE22_05880 [Firmicutes bacterium]|nr:hypothetical protein [Bacillota bacterium]
MYVAAKCTACNASIEVDDEKDAGICNFCGTAFVTQKVINEHHTHVTKNVTKNVFGIGSKTYEDFCEDGDTFLKLREWEKAEEAFKQATTINPKSYLGWLGLARVQTDNWLDYYDTNHKESIERARLVATEDEKKIIDETYSKFKEKAEYFTKIDRPLSIREEKMHKCAVGVGAFGFLFLFVALGVGIALGVALDGSTGWIILGVLMGVPLICVGLFFVFIGKEVKINHEKIELRKKFYEENGDNIENARLSKFE